MSNHTIGLERSREVRTGRAQLRHGLAAGELGLADAIHHKHAETMAIYDLLICVRYIGPERARRICRRLRIGERRQCAELTLRQKGVIVAEVQR